MISSPFCLFDCDRFTDACTVIIVSAGDALDEVKTTPIRIAASAGSVERYSWDQADYASAYPTGRDLWRNTDYTVDDLDMVQLYDGFAFQPITWLEGLGVCELGEGHRFIEGGTRIALDGELPMNTGGGQLSFGQAGSAGGMHHVCDATRQLTGRAGAAQVPDCSVAFVSGNGGIMGEQGALVLQGD